MLQRQPKVQRVVYPGLANLAQRELAHRQMTTQDGYFAPGMLYFESKGRTAMSEARRKLPSDSSTTSRRNRTQSRWR